LEAAGISSCIARVEVALDPRVVSWLEAGLVGLQCGRV
jgi:hypothetical protein